MQTSVQQLYPLSTMLPSILYRFPQSAETTIPVQEAREMSIPLKAENRIINGPFQQAEPLQEEEHQPIRPLQSPGIWPEPEL